MRLAKMGVYDAQGVPGNRSLILFLCAVVGLFALAGLLCRATAAFAASAPAPSPSPSPTIVSEVTGKETMFSNTYRLSDGSYQAHIYSSPIRFKDSRGAWQSFNTNLVSAGPAGVYHATNLPVALTWARTPALARRLCFRPMDTRLPGACRTPRPACPSLPAPPRQLRGRGHRYDALLPAARTGVSNSR